MDMNTESNFVFFHNLLETLFFKILWSSGHQVGDSNYSFIYEHSCVYQSSIHQIGKGNYFLNSVWEEKEIEGCMTGFTGI